MTDKEEKKTLSLIFDPPSFSYPHPFWNFDHPPVNYDLETSKKRDVPMIPTQNPHHWTDAVFRLEKRHTWPKFVISVTPAFSCSVAMCHVEGTLLIKVEFKSLKAAKKDSWSSRQKNYMN